jgi:hypothetical protein
MEKMDRIERSVETVRQEEIKPLREFCFGNGKPGADDTIRLLTYYTKIGLWFLGIIVFRIVFEFGSWIFEKI